MATLLVGELIGGEIVSALYELELRHGEGSEIRQRSQPLTPGERIIVDGKHWRVLYALRPLSRRVHTRYVCVPLWAEARSQGGDAA